MHSPLKWSLIGYAETVSEFLIAYFDMEKVRAAFKDTEITADDLRADLDWRYRRVVEWPHE